MATTEEALTSDWTLLGDGTIPYTPRQTSAEVAFVTSSTSAPEATAAGHFLRKNEPVDVVSPTGEWAWVRVAKNKKTPSSVKG